MTTLADRATIEPHVANDHVHAIHLKRGLLITDCLECQSIMFVNESAEPALSHKQQTMTLETSDPIFACRACRANSRPVR